jgi:hypothetical protein
MHFSHKDYWEQWSTMFLIELGLVMFAFNLSKDLLEKRNIINSS